MISKEGLTVLIQLVNLKVAEWYKVLPKIWHEILLGLKGQLISKCLFGAFNFLQKTKENKSTWGFIVVK